ncbi:hypothetical protein QQ054_11325 [Oscillatoria amoena NRMC-F 0135]|nr:hypothetical protein [Oscillatoria amoena NRMC-F 0135]
MVKNRIVNIFEICLWKIYKSLYFSNIAIDILKKLIFIILENLLESKIKKLNIDCIFTVFHGYSYLIALKISNKLNIKLVTFFHDYWIHFDELRGSHINIANQQFLKLISDSNIRFYISENFKNQCKDSEGTVLLPIPAYCTDRPTDLNPSNNITYAGSLVYPYKSSLLRLIQSCINHNFNDLHIYGPRDNFSLLDDPITEMFYKGYLKKPDLARVLWNSRVLLVVIAFDEGMRLRAETSFSSKLLEYLQYEKPIIIWGPNYSATAQWAIANNAAIVVDKDDPHYVLDYFKKLTYNEVEFEQWSLNSKTNKNNFNYHAIQNQFLFKMDALMKD